MVGTNSSNDAQPQLRRPVAVITGSSSGIGQELALQLAKQGWRVFAGVRKLSDAAQLLQDSNITPIILDVTSEEGIAAAKKQVQQELGNRAGVNLLVNNAGRPLTAQPSEFVPLEQWREVLDVNLQGPLAVTQAFLPLLRQSQPGQARIINISSAGHLALPFWSAYNVSKAGLDMLTECLRYELAPQGISVVLVKPGSVTTPIWNKGRGRFEEVLSNMPTEAQALYGTHMIKIKEFMAKSEASAIAVGDCVKVIMQAATAPKPYPVYLVGNGGVGLMYWLKRLMPAWLWARFMQRVLC